MPAEWRSRGGRCVLARRAESAPPGNSPQARPVHLPQALQVVFGVLGRRIGGHGYVAAALEWNRVEPVHPRMRPNTDPAHSGEASTMHVDSSGTLGTYGEF